MGLFNTIWVDDEIDLPDLPSEVKHRNFQTKDLMVSALNVFRLRSDGILLKQNVVTRWVDDKSALLGGYMDTVSESWDGCDFTGVTHFYTSFHHADDESYKKLYSGINYTFSDGWVEYKAKFYNGVLVKPIELVEFRPAINRNEEEKNLYIEKIQEKRKEMENRCRERRKTNPSVGEKLIDDIYNDIMSVYAIPTMEDYGRILNIIREKIDNYRKEYDKYYEKI